MASSRKDSSNGAITSSNWFAEVLLQLMQENKVSVATLAERVDRSPALIKAVLDGSHVPSILLAERLLQSLGHDLEVMGKKNG